MQNDELMQYQLWPKLRLQFHIFDVNICMKSNNIFYELVPFFFDWREKVGILSHSWNYMFIICAKYHVSSPPVCTFVQNHIAEEFMSSETNDEPWHFVLKWLLRLFVIVSVCFITWKLYVVQNNSTNIITAYMFNVCAIYYVHVSLIQLFKARKFNLMENYCQCVMEISNCEWNYDLYERIHVSVKIWMDYIATKY